MAKLIYTCFYIGYLPFMPGTWASLAALALYYFFGKDTALFLGITLFLLVLGFLVSGRAEKDLKTKDPREAVIDEFSSQLLVFAFLPFNLMTMAWGFVLFRIFDIVKLPPVKKIQDLPRGWGIMLDDIAVAIFVNLILQVGRYL